MKKVSNSSIYKNTLYLYGRMFVSLFISLFTSRVVLQTLGVEDYGINAVVGSVVGMFGVIQTSMIGATSRFLTFEMGKGDEQKLKDTFSTALTVHIIIALILFLLLETVGLWLLNSKLVIPENRMFSANCIYQFSILSTMFGVTQTPYSSCIVAHERFGYYAYIEILNTALKLLILYVLLVIAMDKLILYGILTLAVSILIMMISRIYCIRNFPESHYHFIWKKDILKPILEFSGWDVLGNLSVMARGQGVAMLLNIFFGPIMNAAAGIANTVTGAVSGFASNVTMAIRPQLIKRYAEGDIVGMSKLMSEGTRLNYILLTFLSIPLICEMHFVLFIWLGQVPPSAQEFTILTLLFSVSGCLGGIVMIVIHATGRIKRTSIINGCIYLFVLPVTYIAFKNGMPSWIPFLYNAIAISVTSIIGIYLLHLYIPKFQAKRYLTDDVLRCVLVYILVMGVVYAMHLFLEEGWIRLLVSISVTVVVTSLFSYYVLLTNELKANILRRIKEKFHYE